MNNQAREMAVERAARPLWRALGLLVLSQVECENGCEPERFVRVYVSGDGSGQVKVTGEDLKSEGFEVGIDDHTCPVLLFPTRGLTQTQPLAAPASGNQLLDLVGSYSEIELATGATTELNATYTMQFAVARPAGSAMPVLNGRFGTSASASVYYQIPYAELPEGEWISHQVSFAATEVGALFFRVANHATNGDSVYLDRVCLLKQ